MTGRLELLAEASRRGILPADKKPLYEEAVKRGLIPSQPTKAQRAYAEEDAARKKANEEAPWYEKLGTGVKAQAGRTMLGVYELANNLTGDRLMDPEVLAEAQREADRTDAGTGAWGAGGNVVGDFRNYVPFGKGAQAAAKARTLKEAAKQSAKIGAAAGAVTGLSEGTRNADSTVADNLGNAARGAGIGAGIGAALPVGVAGVKKGVDLASGATNRAMAFAGSDAAARNVAYKNIARLLTEEGYTPSEVAGVIDEFNARGIDGGTLGQILQSGDLLAREKNLLQGGGKAGRVMAENLRDQPKKIADSILRKVSEVAQPEQTDYLYRQAAELADAPTATQTADDVASMGQSAAARELPFTLNAIEEDLAARSAELPSAVIARIRRIIDTAKQSGGFEAADTAKTQLDDLYKAASTTTDQDIVNDVVLGYRRMLNDSLEHAGGDTYRAAKQASLRDMAMNEVADAVKGAQGASVKTALNKFFGSLEQQQDFLRKLPDGLRDEFSAYLDSLQKVSGRFGGSDTASNTATQKAMAAETGVGFDPNLNPLTVLDRVTAPLQRRVRKSQAEVSFSPDASRLEKAMQKNQFRDPTPPEVTKTLSVEATKATQDKGVTRTGPSITVRSRSESDLPKVDLPKPPGPRSDTGPDLMGRIRMAESSGNDNAKNPNSSASGPFQFTDGTWASAVAKWGKEHGVGFKDKDKPQAQAKMAAALARDNARILTGKLGRSPSKGELYMAHVFGAKGAEKLIRARGGRQDAVMLFPPKVVKANKSLFFDGDKPRKAASLYALLENKIMSEG